MGWQFRFLLHKTDSLASCSVIFICFLFVPGRHLKPGRHSTLCAACSSRKPQCQDHTKCSDRLALGPHFIDGKTQARSGGLISGSPS